MSSSTPQIPASKIEQTYNIVKKKIDQINSKIFSHNILTTLKIAAFVFTMFFCAASLPFYLPVGGILPSLIAAGLAASSFVGIIYLMNTLGDKHISFLKEIDSEVTSLLSKISFNVKKSLAIQKPFQSYIPLCVDYLKLDTFKAVEERYKKTGYFFESPLQQSKYYC
jgi:hypothetical protein